MRHWGSDGADGWLDGDRLMVGDELLMAAAEIALAGRHNLANALAILGEREEDNARLEEALEKLWPRTMASHHSQTWGDDNGFSHLRASFMGPQVTAPVHRGEPVLGTWQAVFFCEFDGPRQRRVLIEILPSR